ncbi:MAG TPA: anti-sigma factor, partial [Paracoccaceae bacterium]
GGWALARLSQPAMMQASLADTALRAHATYVVEVVHPVEVQAEEAAHLTGWLSKRLGRPLAPPDFSTQGFRLMGGRVVPSGAGPAALLMYEDDLGRRVTLFAAPGKAGGDTAFQFAQSDKAQSFTWVDGALSYAVSGDIPREVLRALALSAYDQLI